VIDPSLVSHSSALICVSPSTIRRDVAASAEAVDHNNPIYLYHIIAIVSHTIEISSHDVTSWRPQTWIRRCHSKRG
jgi:hypothetical protein